MREPDSAAGDESTQLKISGGCYADLLASRIMLAPLGMRSREHDARREQVGIAAS